MHIRPWDFFCVKIYLLGCHPLPSVCLSVWIHVCVSSFIINLSNHGILIGETGSDNSRQKKPATGKTVTYEKANWVKVPKIYWDLTRTAVLTMEWVDGIKLTDEIGLKKACLNRRKLIDQVLVEIARYLSVLTVHNDVFLCVSHDYTTLKLIYSLGFCLEFWIYHPRIISLHRDYIAL